jgi:hypothetical protein
VNNLARQLRCPWSKKHVQNIVLSAKICKGKFVEWGWCVLDCINVYGGGNEREHTPMVCVKEHWVEMLFSMLITHIADVCVCTSYKEKNLTSNRNLPVDCNQVEWLFSTLQTYSVPWKLCVGWQNIKPLDKPLVCEVEKQSLSVKHVQIIVLYSECMWNVRAVCIRIYHQSICCGEWPYSCGVCNRALSSSDILNVLLYTSQVCV